MKKVDGLIEKLPYRLINIGMGRNKPTKNAKVHDIITKYVKTREYSLDILHIVCKIHVKNHAQW